MMQTSELILALDQEIARLEKVRQLLVGNGAGKRATRAANSVTSVAFGANDGGTSGKRRKMSAAGRARIAAAQKARWAKLRKERAEKS
jgi:hypothetical protein